MDRHTVALICQEGGKFITQLIMTRVPKRTPVITRQAVVVEEQAQEVVEETASIEEGKASSIASGCVPCSLGHLSVCTGIINEGMRFARSDGMESNEVIDRVTHCLQELNSLEREDLTPEMTINLPSWEKELAIEALNTSRATRHLLEGATTIDDLEKAAANTQTANTQIARKWFKQRLKNMSKGQKEELAGKAIERLEEEEK